MKSLVVYSSRTGNTRKIAEAIYNLLEGTGTLYNVDTAPDPEGYDLVAVCFWLAGGKPDPEASKYLAKAGACNLFLAATHGCLPESEHAAAGLKQAYLLTQNSTLRGTFNCQGEVDPAFLEKAARKQPQPPWLKDAKFAAGHPDEKDFERLETALKEALALCSRSQ